MPNLMIKIIIITTMILITIMTMIMIRDGLEIVNFELFKKI